MADRADRIEQREGEWCAVSEDGSRSFGCFDTESQARERLRQVEAAVEAKGDSVFRIDKLGILHFDKTRSDGFLCETTDEGFLKVDGLLTRTGVFQYADADGETWGEFRDAKEVFNQDSLDSFKMVVVTDDHPSEMVTTENVKDVQVGSVGSDVRRDGDFVRASMIITDKSVIRSIEDGKVELSLGYFTRVVQDAGVAPDGTPFTSRQQMIRGNHCSLVQTGRAGPACRLQLDSGDAITPEGIFMKKIEKKVDATVMVGGEEHDVPDSVAEAFKEMTAKMERQAAELAKLSEPASEEDEMIGEEEVVVEEEDQMKPTTDAMQAKIDSLEAALKASTDGQSAVIDARVSLVTDARKVLGDEVKTDGVPNLEIQKAVVASVTPSMKDKLDGKSADYVQAAYEMAMDQFGSRVDSTQELLTLTASVITDGAEDDIDKIYADAVARITSGGRKPTAQEIN